MEPNEYINQPIKNYPVQPTYPVQQTHPYTIPVNHPPPPPYNSQLNIVQYGAASPARSSSWSRRKKICVITAVVVIKVIIGVGLGVGLYFARSNTYNTFG
ncbi:hypothetical protein XELAEV_18011399mg [Xenopus laevis]|uniref:Uncharacterized protein n=1 Tax=Xenopus laevis TaxID=8355 RepID=A0A974HXE7_XENLA|nr:hypothetical protein XELAEV_18011399mg [Xenopus laevis]